MILLDIYVKAASVLEAAEDRNDLFDAACAMGDVAFASEGQLFLLTDLPFEEVARRLQAACGDRDFLKIQEVAGRFVLTGSYPDSVHDLLERAGGAGAVSLDWSSRPEPGREAAAPETAWLH